MLAFETNETLDEARARNVRDALFEDLGRADWTGQLVPEGRRVQARVIVREAAVLCGRHWFCDYLHALDATADVQWRYAEGARIGRRHAGLRDRGRRPRAARDLRLHGRRQGRPCQPLPSALPRGKPFRVWQADIRAVRTPEAKPAPEVRRGDAPASPSPETKAGPPSRRADVRPAPTPAAKALPPERKSEVRDAAPAPTPLTKVRPAHAEKVQLQPRGDAPQRRKVEPVTTESPAKKVTAPPEKKKSEDQPKKKEAAPPEKKKSEGKPDK